MSENANFDEFNYKNVKVKCFGGDFALPQKVNCEIEWFTYVEGTNHPNVCTFETEEFFKIYEKKVNFKTPVKCDRVENVYYKHEGKIYLIEEMFISFTFDHCDMFEGYFMSYGGDIQHINWSKVKVVNSEKVINFLQKL